MNVRSSALLVDDGHTIIVQVLTMMITPSRPLASDALQRYRNAILRNCNAIFDFQITLFTAILTFLIT